MPTKTTFFHLPPEIRNTIYELSGCLSVVQCQNCRKHATFDTALNYKRTCSGSPRIAWPIRYPRNFQCQFILTPCIDLARYGRDWAVTHEYIDPNTDVLAIPQPTECRLPEQPFLTRVCRLIRSETLPMYYGLNKFVFTPQVAAAEGYARIATADIQWLAALGATNVRLIRNVEIRWLGWCRSALLSDFKQRLEDMGMKLDQVEVEVSCWTDEDRWSSGFPGKHLTGGT